MPLACDTNGDRSVQGAMNQMKQDLEHMLWYDSIDITELNPYRAAALQPMAVRNAMFIGRMC